MPDPQEYVLDRVAVQTAWSRLSGRYASDGLTSPRNFDTIFEVAGQEQDPFKRAGLLAEGMCLGQPFESHNRQLGAALAVETIERTGHTVNVDANTMIEKMRQLETREIKAAEFGQWLKDNSRPPPDKSQPSPDAPPETPPKPSAPPPVPAERPRPEFGQQTHRSIRDRVQSSPPPPDRNDRRGMDR